MGMNMDTFLNAPLGLAVAVPFSWLLVRIADHISGHRKLRKLWGKR